MQSILCATGNSEKFGIAKHILAEFGVDLVQTRVKIDEIQGEDPVVIVRDKAKKAFSALDKPVVVTDDSWDIPALNGFPGPYMKSVNHWFTPQDFIALMHGKTDRRIFIHQYVAYYDGSTAHVFTGDLTGEIAAEPRGKFGEALMRVVALERDHGLTISERYDQGNAHDDDRLAGKDDAWRQLGRFLQEEAK